MQRVINPWSGDRLRLAGGMVVMVGWLECWKYLQYSRALGFELRGFLSSCLQIWTLVAGTPPPVTQRGQGRTMVATLWYGVRRAGRVAADAWQWQSSNSECTPTGQPLRKLMTCACVGYRDMAGQKGSDEAGWMAQTYMSHLVSTK